MTEPTHRCTVCHALWTHWPDGTWNLRSLKCGPCCDNVPMADQIVAIAPSRAEIERDTIARLAAQGGVSGEELWQRIGQALADSGSPECIVIINEALAAAVAKERVRAANMFWDPDSPEAPMETPFDEMGDWGRDNGVVHEVWQAARLPSVYVAQLPPADDADSDDEWTCEADTREEAQTMLDAELERRKRVESGEIDNG